MRRKTFEEIEKEEIAKLERRALRGEAKRIAQRKVELGLKYKDLDFGNISDQKLKDLEKREKKDQRKQAFIKKGKEVLSQFGSQIKQNKAARNIERARPQGTFASSDSNVFGTMQHRNIHEGVGRNIWEEDKKKKTIWD